MTVDCPLRRDFKSFAAWWKAYREFSKARTEAEAEERKATRQELRMRRRATHYDEREQRKTVEAWKRIKGDVLKRKAERENKERDYENFR